MDRRRLLLSVCALAVAGSASAAPAHVDEHLAQARVAGKGTFTWFGLSIYEAELWVGEKGYRADPSTIQCLALRARTQVLAGEAEPEEAPVSADQLTMEF